MARFTRTKCDCKNCPLQDRKRVRGISGADSFKVAIIGEAPGEEEDQKGEPFVGSAGHKLKEAVASAGLIWHLVYKTNVLMCRPPDNEIESIEGQLAIKCCMPGFKEEVAWMEKNGTKVLVPTGNTSMNALGIEGKIGKYRGSVFEVGKMIAVPTYHPSFILRGMWKEEPTWINDLAKARDLSLKKWSKPKENFNLFPTEKDVKDFVERAIDEDLLVASDLETTSLNEYYAKILMNGLAVNGEDAIVVPFTKKGGTDYWTMPGYSRVWKLVDKLYLNCRTMFQNASYDALILAHQGHAIKKLEHDTLLLHHCISPELPHNLGYIVSVYGKTPYWKEVVLGSEDKMIGMDDAEVRTYNARDTVVLHQVLPDMLQHLKEVGTENIYREVSMNLVFPLMRMHRNGMALDKGRLKKKATQFKKEATRTENELRKLCGLPEAFNFDSGDHMRLLVHGEKPKSWNATKTALEAYDVNKKLRRDTKKYAALVSKWDVFTGITSLNAVDGEQIVAPGRDSSVDAMSMLSLERKAILAIQSLDKLKNQTERVQKKREAYERIRKFIQLHRKYSGAHILATTFSGFPTGPDGRVHLPFKIHGTKTGRLSSGSDDEDQKINGQNIPEEVQDVFVAGPGRSIVKWDYSNIEYRVMAMMTGEKDLEARFDAGENFHDINTRLLFGIDKDHPQWDVYRRAAKTFIFGLSYGGTINGIYSKILVKVPEMNLSLTQFTKIVNDYFDALPNYKAWREMITKQAVNTRCVETAFGRKRFLLGMPQDIEREALNCVDYETQALTRTGWKRGNELVVGEEILCKNAETDELVWQPIKEVCLWPKAITKVIEFDHPTLSAASTLDHRWLVFDKYSKKNICVKTNEMSMYGDHRIHRTGVYVGVPEAKLSDDVVRFLGWVLTDGNFKKGTPGTTAVTIMQSPWANRTKVAKIDLMFDCLKVRRTRYQNPYPGYVTWTVSGEFAKFIRSLVPGRILNMDLLNMLTSEQCSLLFDTMLEGDGSSSAKDSHIRFTARDERRAEMMQILASLAGFHATYKYRDFSKYHPAIKGRMHNSPKMTGAFIVEIRRRDKTQILAKHRVAKTIKGVWCPIVPSTYFLAKRRGTVYVTGNTPIQGTAGEVLLRTLSDLDEALLKKFPDAMLVDTVHDSILADVKNEETMAVAKLGKKIMERPFKLFGREVRFPVDTEIGPSWGETKKVDL